MERTPREQMELMGITGIFNQLVAETSDGQSSYHYPHAVVGFCHTFFHLVFQPELEKRARDLHQRVQAGEEIEGVEADGAIASFRIESVMLQAFEVAFLTGYGYGRRGHTLSACRCIEKVGDEVEAHLRQKENGQ